MLVLFIANKSNYRRGRRPRRPVNENYDYGEYVDNMFFCHPNTLIPYHLLCLSYLSLNDHTIDSFEYYELQKAVNDLREFHGLPMLDIPYVEEYEYELMTPEERRQKAIDDELEEYLRIGEQTEKEKNR